MALFLCPFSPLNILITLFSLNHKPEKDFEVLDPNLHHSRQLELWEYCL